MPELPEVETVRKGLARLIVGKSIKNIIAGEEKSFPNSKNDVSLFAINSTIQAITRRAKVLQIHLDSDYSFVIHLKMTGQLVYVGEQRFGAGHPSDSLVNALPDSSTRVTIEFSDGTYLYFNDQRKFGWMKLMPTVAVSEMPFMQKVGPEPLEDSFTLAVFKGRLARHPRAGIKATLLNQAVLAGVGNIYADESLWAAKVHPSRRTSSLSEKEYAALHSAIRSIMNQAIEEGGSSNHTYINTEGKKGSYMTFARVFRREGLSCSRCGETIIKIRVAGRGTHICPVCQPEDDILIG